MKQIKLKDLATICEINYSKIKYLFRKNGYIGTTKMFNTRYIGLEYAKEFAIINEFRSTKSLQQILQELDQYRA